MASSQNFLLLTYTLSISAVNICNSYNDLDLILQSSDLQYADSINPFQMNRECRKRLIPFMNASRDFSYCSLNNSIPPSVCTNCYDEYLTLRETYHNLTCADDRPCSHNCTQTIFNNYLISYVKVVYDELTSNIWNASYCTKCVEVYRDPLNPYKELANETQLSLGFQTKLLEFRMCIINITYHQSSVVNKTAAICERCWNEYASVYDFFINKYIKTEENFCLDIQATLNDTVYIWRTMYKCARPYRPDRSHDSLGVAILVSVTAVFIASFYAAAFAIVKRKDNQTVSEEVFERGSSISNGGLNSAIAES